MKYRKVGDWPLEVSQIALGTGDNAGGIVYGSPKEQRELVERALALGINLFDCSPDYGKGLGEANLGRVLKEVGARDALIITKVEIMPEDCATGRIGAKVLQSVSDSLLRLQRDHVDVVMLHNPVRLTRNPNIRFWMRLSPADVLQEVLPALRKLRDEGKTRFLGLACEASESAAVQPLLATREFTMINAWFNLANPTAAVRMDEFPPEENYDGLFRLAREYGAGVAVIRPLAGGALTDAILNQGVEARHTLSRGYYRDNPGALVTELERGRRFKFLSQPGRTLSEAAYRFIFARQEICTVVGGFSDTAHLAEAAQATDADDLNPSEMAAIEAMYRSGFRTVREDRVASI